MFNTWHAIIGSEEGDTWSFNYKVTCMSLHHVTPALPCHPDSFSPLSNTVPCMCQSLWAHDSPVRSNDGTGRSASPTVQKRKKKAKSKNSLNHAANVQMAWDPLQISFTQQRRYNIPHYSRITGQLDLAGAGLSPVQLERGGYRGVGGGEAPYHFFCLSGRAATPNPRDFGA